MMGVGAGDMAMGFPGNLLVSLLQEHQETGKDVRAVGDKDKGTVK